MKQLSEDAYRNRVGGNSCESGVRQPGRRFAGTGIRNLVHTSAFMRDGRASIGAMLMRRVATVLDHACLALFLV